MSWWRPHLPRVDPGPLSAPPTVEPLGPRSARDDPTKFRDVLGRRLVIECSPLTQVLHVTRRATTEVVLTLAELARCHASPARRTRRPARRVGARRPAAVMARVGPAQSLAAVGALIPWDRHDAPPADQGGHYRGARFAVAWRARGRYRISRRTGSRVAATRVFLRPAPSARSGRG